MPEVGGRTVGAALARAVFVVALGVAIGAQLAIMSVLDSERADDAARAVSESEFAVELVDDAVRRAVSPTAGDELGAQIAQQASTDPRVAEVLRLGLIDAHRSIVEPDAVASTGSAEVQTVLDDLLTEAEARTGIDLDAVRSDVGAPAIDPRFVPDAGARPLTQGVRTLAAMVALIAALLAVAVHPRPGRAIAGLGIGSAIVCGIWAVVLLVLGWLIGTFTGTLFGRLLDAIWRASSSAMLLVVGAGAVLGIALWFGGVAVDGFTRRPRGGVARR
jgi:hypothetical protein